MVTYKKNELNKIPEAKHDHGGIARLTKDPSDEAVEQFDLIRPSESHVYSDDKILLIAIPEYRSDELQSQD